jgi:PKD repeat protein
MQSNPGGGFIMKGVMKFILISVVIFFGAAIFLSGIFTNPADQESESPKQVYPTIIKTISGETLSVYLVTFGNITFNTTVPESPATLQIYTGIMDAGDLIDVSNGSSVGHGVNVPLGSDAFEIAVRELNAYGGLPSDAIPAGITTSYAELDNSTTYEFERRYAEDTMVSFTRRINGRYIMGDTDIIRVLLGDNGRLIWVYKEWRNYTNAGDVPVIPVEKAIKKLEKGDTINQYLSPAEEVTIYNITLGYYVTGLEDPVTTLEPVWIFSGDTPSGSSISFKVYARQFANFTATPTSGKIPLNITFTDTSETKPDKWLWDFGDGTNSTAQNPSHTYASAGIYNVSLRAWNDLGSDTMEKAGYISVRDPAAPVANFTASPLTGGAPMNVSFRDTSLNTPNTWLWTFGDDTNSTMQNPTHTYSAAGNYTVSLNVTNEDGTDSIIRPDYITVTNLPQTTLTTKPTTIVTTLVTTTATTTTTKPKPTPTHAPLSPVIAISGLALVGLFKIFTRENYGQ